MDINQVSYFLNLAEILNFTEAARRSGVSRPSLTRAIQRLEEEMGSPLIYRDGKDSRLTARVIDVAVATTNGPAASTAFFDNERLNSQPPHLRLPRFLSHRSW